MLEGCVVNISDRLNPVQQIQDTFRRKLLLNCLLAFGLLIATMNYGYAQDKTFLIGFPEDNMANDWRAAQVRQLVSEFKKYPKFRFRYSDAGGQISTNIKQIEDMVQAGVDLLFLGPRNAKFMTPVVRDLRKRGVRVILLTRRIESEDFDSFIGPSDFEIAKSAAEFLGRHLKGKGRILMLEGVPTATTAIKRSAGFRLGLKGFPGVEIVDVRSGNYSRRGGIAAIEKALKDGVKFDAIYSHNDAMLIGARLALRAGGIDPTTVASVGIDYLGEAREAIRKGEQTASFTYPICGKEGAAAAIELLSGGTIPKYITVPSQLVTRENVEKIIPIF